jgi:hypothetical protein
VEAPTTREAGNLPCRDAIDAVLKLADASWREFDPRRSDEWRVNFGLWTALALFAGVVLRGDLRFQVDRLQFVSLAVILAGIWVVYTFVWTRGLRERQVRSLDSAHFYRDRVEEIVAQNLPENVSLDGSPRRRGGRVHGAGLWRHWSHGSQIYMTTFLIVLDFWSIWIRRSG